MSPMPDLAQKTARAPARTGLIALLLMMLPAVPSRAAQSASTPPAKPIQLSGPAKGGSAAPAAPVVRIAPAPTTPPSSPTITVPAARTKPQQKQAAKPGPGANDAGKQAANLRTTKVPLFNLIDRSVVGRQKREIGHVVDVLIDAKGEPAALVVDVGGFLGMGNRRIAIGWERFTLAGRKPGDALQIPFSDAQIKAAPAYGGAREVDVVQGAIKPAANQAAIPSSRVSLGEDLGPLSTDNPSSVNALNPD